MKRINEILFALVAGVLFIASCTPMDDYKKYIEDGEARQYTGRVDSVRFYPGNERVLFYGLLTSDPKIAQVKINWNTHTSGGLTPDSLVLDIERSQGVDTLRVFLALPEGKYNFTVRSFDSEGHSSIPVVVSSTVYGAAYRQDLYNRSIKSVVKDGADATIQWYNGDESSPFTRITYTDVEDRQRIVDVVPTEKETTLPDYKSMSKFQLQTYFLPEENAVDTFKVEPQLIGVPENLTHLIKNPGNPFRYDERIGKIGKWGVVADWEHNANVLNQEDGTVGGWSDEDDNWDGIYGCIHFESDHWSAGPITNGKIWQTTLLAAGNYEFVYQVARGGGDWTLYFVVMKGKGEIPDVEEVETDPRVLEYSKLPNNNTQNYPVTIRLDTAGDVTYGWVASAGTGCYLRIKWISLRSFE